MSGRLRKPLFFSKIVGKYADRWGHIVSQDRSWEDAYRDRWAHDKKVRSTHACDCSGSCSWELYVKDGIITWEEQATDYQPTPAGVPNHEPRGCQRGSSYSWYLYSAARVKHPLIRGELLELWREARKSYTPIEAWKTIVERPEQRDKYVKARGLGGFVRASWDEVTDIIAAANLYTVAKYGPDRVTGFGVVPAPALISYGTGNRYLALMGGTQLSFFDWNCDQPPASSQTWGEKYDSPTSDNWYYSSYIVVWGANLSMTRCPDAHFLTEARYNGAKVVNICPDYVETTKDADWWLHIKQGTDAALGMALSHVIFQEFHVDNPDPYFTDYLRRYTDMPMLVKLEPQGEGYVPGQTLRASELGRRLAIENADWKTVLWDDISGRPVVPQGSIGYRWTVDGKPGRGKWNLEQRDGETGDEFQARLSFIDGRDDVFDVQFPYFGGMHHDGFDGNPQPSNILVRKVPVKYLDLPTGKIPVATVFDLVGAYLGVNRGLGGQEAKGYDDNIPFTPRWQQQITGLDAKDVVTLAREFATAASQTHGRACICMGAGICQWFNTDNNHRSMMYVLMLCGTCGVPGGGWSFYVGQEKARPESGFGDFAFAKDWVPNTRYMNSPSYWFTQTDQWRYDRIPLSDMLSPLADPKEYHGTYIDYNTRSIMHGWLPTAPQLNRNPLMVSHKARDLGVDPVDYVVESLKDGTLHFAAQDPDAPENWPRNLFVWRGNLLGTSGKGQEYFLKHLVGAQSSIIGHELSADEGLRPEIVKWREAPEGKLDLLVNLDFHMTTTAIYSDIVLPSCSWYEKNDLNTTDLHSFINPIGKAVSCAWESRSDWDAFKLIAKKVSELAARSPQVFGNVEDILLSPLGHDTPQELGQPFEVQSWFEGECDLIPGKTAPSIQVIKRDYRQIYDKMCSIGPLLEENGGGNRGIVWGLGDEMKELAALNGTVHEGVAKGRPKLDTDVDCANYVLRCSPQCNGTLAYNSWDFVEYQTGMPCKQVSAEHYGDKMTFDDLMVRPLKTYTGPDWLGVENDYIPYVAFYQNVQMLLPWRTLTGRQQFYQDHPWMSAFGQNFPQYRMPANQRALTGLQDLKPNGHKAIALNFLTAHQKWGIHSTYFDNERMLSLSRGGPVLWLSQTDADSAGIADNDWVEAWNANGAFVGRAIVSSRIRQGMCMVQHATEKTINTPGSEITGHRGGGHNGPTRLVMNPTNMIGGYAQQSYDFNYHGTVAPNRDDFVWLRKLDKVDWMEEEATPEGVVS